MLKRCTRAWYHGKLEEFVFTNLCALHPATVEDEAVDESVVSYASEHSMRL